MAKLIYILWAVLLMVVSLIWIMLVLIGYQSSRSPNEQSFLSEIFSSLMKKEVVAFILLIIALMSFSIPVVMKKAFLEKNYTYEEYEEAIESAYSEGYDDGYSDGKED